LEFRKTFYTWLTTKFSLIVRNEENLEDKYYIPITPAMIVLFAFSAFIMIFILGIFVGNFIFQRSSLQGIKEAKVKEQLYQMNIVIDSLSEALEARETYVQDLKKVMGGNMKKLRNTTDLFKTDTLKKQKNNTGEAQKNAPKFTFGNDSLNIDYLESADVKLRQEFENPNKTQNLQNTNFISPAEGVLQSHFKPAKQKYGVSITLPKESPIKSIASGRILDITEENGYFSVMIQHSGGIVSIYRNCKVLLKKVGNFVELGEVVGLSGSSTKEILYFELWYQGSPINPEELINF